MHEAKMHPVNSFLNLTYSDEELPENNSVSKRHLQLFFKRLRKSLGSQKIRYFACGEYGDKTGRPHYHALIFNYRPTDLKFYKHSQAKNSKLTKYSLYTSSTLEKIWTHGQVQVGSVTYQSAGYCARYVTKKITGARADQHYTRLSLVTGEVYRVSPEFSLSSRRPGLGSSWFDKYQSDAFPSDYIVVNGSKLAVPRYYLNKLKEEEQQPIKRLRKQKANKHRADQTPARLKVREEVLASRINRLQREL